MNNLLVIYNDVLPFAELAHLCPVGRPTQGSKSDGSLVSKLTAPATRRTGKRPSSMAGGSSLKHHRYKGDSVANGSVMVWGPCQRLPLTWTEGAWVRQSGCQHPPSLVGHWAIPVPLKLPGLEVTATATLWAECLLPFFIFNSLISLTVSPWRTCHLCPLSAIISSDL